ncbi:MAG: cupin domain-containing protein [Pseudomonadota bacterium]|nr:cupin domain-containing protein [Pseudomonadota bacterium]
MEFHGMPVEAKSRTRRPPASAFPNGRQDANRKGVADESSGLGLRLKHARLIARLTLKEVADAATCSVSLVSKIENSKALPSISTLHRLVQALGTNVSALFERPNEELGIVCRTGDRPIIPLGSKSPVTGARVELLTQHQSGRLLQACIHIVPPGGGSDGTLRHAGEEVGYVLTGQLDLTVNDRTYRLRKGDSFVFRSELLHGYRNPGRTPAQVIWVNTPPTF